METDYEEYGSLCRCDTEAAEQREYDATIKQHQNARAVIARIVCVT